MELIFGCLDKQAIGITILPGIRQSQGRTVGLIAISTTNSEFTRIAMSTVNSKFPRSRLFRSHPNMTKTMTVRQSTRSMPSNRPNPKPMKQRDIPNAAATTASSNSPMLSEKSNVKAPGKALKKRPAEPVPEVPNKRPTPTPDSRKSLEEKKEQLR